MNISIKKPNGINLDFMPLPMRVEYEQNNNCFVPCPFNTDFLICKYTTKRITEWELCSKNVLTGGDCSAIARICSGMPGTILNVTNLGWEVSTKYQNQGIMSKLLSLYLQEAKSLPDGFAAAILRTNTPSLKLAFKNGFVIYDESESSLYLKRI